MPIWRRIADEGAGFLFSLSESLAIVDWRYPGVLEPVTDGTLVMASDYSGQHKLASHEAYSFVLTTSDALAKWERTRLEFRERWLPDGRRISFKQLSEPVRWRALVPFLEAAGTLRGNVVTFLIDRRIKTFSSGGPAEIVKAMPDCFPPNTNLGTVEKMFRVAGFVALLTAGFRREQQRSFWISDHDEILETFDRREQFGLLAFYLTFGLTRWRNAADMEFATTAAPGVPPWSEDVATIADLIAGACCRLSSLLPTHTGRGGVWTRFVRSERSQDRRATAIANWLASRPRELRQVLLRLELDVNGEPRASAQFFAGTRMRSGPGIIT
jgi:hypothetical protein